MIDELKKNVETEIEILREISSYVRMMDFSPVAEKKLLENTITSLKQSMKIINRSIPDILNNTGIMQKLPSSGAVIKPVTEKNFEKVSIKRGENNLEFTVQKKDRDKLLNELSISEGLIKKVKKTKENEAEKYEEFRAASGYLKTSNKFFQNTASNLINKGYFQSLSLELRRANIDILFETYVAMMLFTMFLSMIAGIFLMIFFMFFSIGINPPFFYLYEGNFLSRFAIVVFIPFVLPIATFLLLQVYPSSEKSSLAKKIEQELPFAVIHMSAISGSGIEPSQIFKIIGLSKDYPNLRREIRKVLNQINIYGYDLVTALNNVSKTTPSSKLSEVFSGLGTTINSGGNLSEFFEKRAETLLVSYRLEREKFTHIAEMFMDIYISVVIAAPMILMLLLVMIGVAMPNATSGFSIEMITFLIVFVIALINSVFLIFLQIKQPAY